MKRLMIVDDSSVIRKVAKHVLGKPDVAIVEAGSGQEALSLCKEHMPDIIVCDVTLPDMMFIDFINSVKEMAEEAMPKIVVNHHEMNLPVIMKAKRAGAAGFLLKPFNRPTLLERFENLGLAA